MKKGELIVISGFSGVGKGTVIRALREAHPEFRYSISATTRAPREGEEDGKDYFFLTHEEFDCWIREDRFLEYACYATNSYGTPREYVEKQRNAGYHILFDIETEGAFNIRRACPDAKLIYLIPPSAEELKRRLIGRGTETAEQIRNRLRKAVLEAEVVAGYDHILINDDVESCADNIYRIAAEDASSDTDRSKALAITEEIRQELPKILKVF